MTSAFARESTQSIERRSVRGSRAAKLSSSTTTSPSWRRARRDEETASLAVRKLPTRLADHLLEASRHALEERPEIELATNGLGEREVRGRRRPRSPHEKVERERAREHAVLVKLRSGDYAAPPALTAQRLLIETVEEEEAGLGLA